MPSLPVWNVVSSSTCARGRVEPMHMLVVPVSIQFCAEYGISVSEAVVYNIRPPSE